MITLKKDNWQSIYNKVELNSLNGIPDSSYQKGFEVGVAYFASYAGRELPIVIDIPETITHRGSNARYSYELGVKKGWEFVNKLK